MFIEVWETISLSLLYIASICDAHRVVHVNQPGVDTCPLLMVPCQPYRGEFGCQNARRVQCVGACKIFYKHWKSVTLIYKLLFQWFLYPCRSWCLLRLSFWVFWLILTLRFRLYFIIFYDFIKIKSLSHVFWFRRSLSLKSYF